ncbi:MAG: hypothetical protein OXT65_05220 [Alphaproteobacteria bacterium]|nr:hypothetical protein [Alphaproteobacteria bacterium]
MTENLTDSAKGAFEPEQEIKTVLLLDVSGSMMYGMQHGVVGATFDTAKKLGADTCAYGNEATWLSPSGKDDAARDDILSGKNAGGSEPAMALESLAETSGPVRAIHVSDGDVFNREWFVDAMKDFLGRNPESTIDFVVAKDHDYGSGIEEVISEGVGDISKPQKPSLVCVSSGQDVEAAITRILSLREEAEPLHREMRNVQQSPDPMKDYMK